MYSSKPISPLGLLGAAAVGVAVITYSKKREIVKVVNVTFNGNVTLQAAVGETVTITITAPDGTKTTLTATTAANSTLRILVFKR